MLRSSSTAHIKIDFNPRQAKVGHSSIDKLPIHRNYSTKSITQVSQISQNQQKMMLQSQQYSIEMLKRINQSLERENMYLKKQLDFFTQACSSRRASLTGIPTVNSKKKEDSGYKDRLMSRIDSKNDTESTGLFNSKVSNSGKKTEGFQQNIAEMYSKFNLKKILPKTETVKQVANSFMESIKQNYLKLRTIVDQINLKNREYEKVPKETVDILNFLQMTVIYCKSPKMGKEALREKQKKMKNTRHEVTKEQKIETFFNQFSTTNDLITLFQNMVKMGMKNAKFIAHLRSSIGFSRLMKRITKNQ